MTRSSVVYSQNLLGPELAFASTALKRLLSSVNHFMKLQLAKSNEAHLTKPAWKFVFRSLVPAEKVLIRGPVVTDVALKRPLFSVNLLVFFHTASVICPKGTFRTVKPFLFWLLLLIF